MLLIEDDPELAQQIGSGSRDAGYAVDCGRDGQDGCYLGQAVPFGLAVLDLGIPGLSAIDVIRRWRASGMAFPILILTTGDCWQDPARTFSAYRRGCVNAAAMPSAKPSSTVSIVVLPP
ncbi:response regulator [Methylolobus aquaticus]